jgi:hypothetical protein
MNPSIRKLLFFWAVAGACGLLIQACVVGPGIGIVWDVSQPVRILPNATSDDQRYKTFQTQLDSQSDGKYDTTFQGKISEARTCYKIDAGTNSQKVQCSDLPHPEAIHVAQRVYFADQAHKDAFLKNLGL